VTLADWRQRFKHLERPRQDEGAPAAPEAAEAQERFDAVEPARPLPGGAGPVPGCSAGRFRAPEGSGLALDVAPEGEQPFVRCASCEADHSRHATRCDRCGADLTTPEQRAYNARLWEERQRLEGEARRALEAQEEARRRDEEASATARRQAALNMADELLARERERSGSGVLRLLGRLGEILSRRHWGDW